MNIKTMPKIELHVHLDGSLRPETVRELLPQVENIENKMRAPLHCKDLNEYLTKFALPLEAMQTKENLVRVSRELAEDLINDQVLYAEVRFAPTKHTKIGLNIEEVLEAVLLGFSSVPIKVNILLSCMRDASLEDNWEVVNLAKKYINRGVVGLDLAGAESLYKTKEYEKLFREAKEARIPFTIHAGEADGPQSIWDALSFGANRIGHGIRAIEDTQLIKKLVEKRIVLEVCPTSNIGTKVVSSYQDHPLKKLYQEGVKVCINTDNRTVSHITLWEEYQNMEKYFLFTLEDFVQMNLNAIEGSFLNKEEKQKLLEEYIKIINIKVDEKH